MVLITPAMPAPDSKWPIFAFTAPTVSGSAKLVCGLYTLLSADTSIGSPSSVPVPWASTYCTSSAAICALANADLITLCCDKPLGAVMPLLRPS